MLHLFFFNDTATTEIYTLSLHDALPISSSPRSRTSARSRSTRSSRRSTLAAWISARTRPDASPEAASQAQSRRGRSEEHTSELQSRQYLVCRLLLEKKKMYTST